MSTSNRQSQHNKVESDYFVRFVIKTRTVEVKVDTLKKTIRLKKEESISLQDKAYSLTKKAIYQGNKIMYQESDIVHYIIDEVLEKVDINEHGKLIIK